MDLYYCYFLGGVLKVSGDFLCLFVTSLNARAD